MIETSFIPAIPLRTATAGRIAGEVALVQVHVPHDHHVRRVAEDAAQAVDLAALAQVLGRERVPEPVRIHPEANPLPQALEQLDHRSLGADFTGGAWRTSRRLLMT
jgi:hypothetical protein